MPETYAKYSAVADEIKATIGIQVLEPIMISCSDIVTNISLFSLFVKETYATAKKSLGLGASHQDIMKEISRLYKDSSKANK